MDTHAHDRAIRYVTHECPGIGGEIKARPEDFLVEEIPAVECAGEGEHIHLFVEKRMLSTLDLVAILARHFGVPRRAIGFAGLKDKVAITRQVVSIWAPGRPLESVPMLDHPRVGVLWADRHTQRLRRGQLAGNRFSIRVRAVRLGSLRDARDALVALESRGVPNRFGPQRFGYRRNNHLVGRALVLDDMAQAVALMVGPSPDDAINAIDQQFRAREMFRRGDLAGALAAFSGSMRAERRLIGTLMRGSDARGAIGALDARERSYFLSAFQSAVFNRLLDDRLERGTLGEIEAGDVWFEHATRATGVIDAGKNAGEDDRVLRERAARMEISPSGPMWGPRMPRARGEIDKRETDALASLGVDPSLVLGWRGGTRSVLEGDRRPYRVALRNPEIEGGVDEHGTFIRCAFDLPRGAFATVVMEEIMKNRGPGGAGMLEEGGE